MSNQTAYALKVLRAAIAGQLPVYFDGDLTDSLTGGKTTGPWDPAGCCWPKWKLGSHYTFTAFNDSGCYDYTVSLVEHYQDGSDDLLWQCDSAGEDLINLLTKREQAKLAKLLAYDGEIGEWLPWVAGVQEGGAA